jgi:hypothetical protein
VPLKRRCVLFALSGSQDKDHVNPVREYHTLFHVVETLARHYFAIPGVKASVSLGH